MKVQIELKGFTPLLDVLVKEFGIVTASVYGIVWRYAQMEDKVCRASLEKIADRLKISSKTAERHIKKLCTSGYLEDLTPRIKNKPHIYIVTGKAELAGVVSPEIRSDRESDLDQLGQTESPTRSDRESDLGQTESPLKIHSKKDNKDINDSAKNPQNHSRAADDNESFVDIKVPCPYCGRVQCDGYKCGKRPTLTQNEKDDLNTLAAHIAKATNTNANDEDSKDRLRAATLLGYEIAKICELIISIIDHADQRMMEQLVKVAISLYQNNVSVEDLEKFKIWWYDNTWQGKKGQTPSPAQIASYWGQFEAQKVINVPAIDTSSGFYV